jgi:PAS domain S-box-containing protein
MKAALPDNEMARLEALEQYKILHTEPEEAFNDFTRLAAQICETPIALMTLIDNNRQQFKSKVGLTVMGIEGEIAFCTYAIQQNEVFVVQDALSDERFATNRLVISDPYLRFYAGAPLITSQGYALGTLCVIDYVPRELSPAQLEALQALSRQIVTQIELRQHLTELAQATTQENQHLETKLRHRELELLDLFENGPSGLHCVDANGIILWVNQAELELLGYSHEEYVGHHISKFYADKAVSNDILQRLSANETLHNYETKLLCKDGSIRYVLINSNVLWEDGKFSHTRCFTRDITERKRVEEVAQQAATENLRLARAVASASDGVIITDPNQPDNPIIYANPASLEITGYEADEVIGRNCRFLQGSDTDPQMVVQIRDCIVQGRECKVTLLNYRKDGQPFWNDLKISPVFSDEGDLLYFVGIQTDITERKRAEEERDRFFTLSLDMLCIANLDGYFMRLNPAWEKTLGYTMEELQSTPFINFVHPEDQVLTLVELEKLAANTPTSYFENRYRALDGSYKWLAWTATPRVEEGLVYAIARDITELKRAEQERIQLLQREQAARQSAENAHKRSTNILESITDAFFAVDHEWRFTYLNPQAERLLQRKQNQLIGKRVWDEFPETVDSTFSREFHKAVSEKVSVEFEGFYPPLDTWFAVHAYPSKDGLCVYFNDITQRKRAQEALRQSEDRLRNLVETTSDWVWEVDENAVYTYVSPKVRDILGYEPEDVLGKTLFDLMPAEEAFRVASIFGPIAAAQKPVTLLENTIIHKEGHLVVLETSGVPFFDSEGLFRGYRGIDRDITERKWAQEQVREQATLLDKSQDAILVLDIEDRILFWNKSAERLFGWSASEAVGSKADELLFKQTPNQLKEAQKIVAQQGEWQGDLHQVTKDGKKILVESRWTLVRDDEEQPKSILVVNTDITEKKQLEAQFLRAQRMESIGTLAGGIAHDLNNVLAPILMAVQLLELKLPDERSQQWLQILETNAKRGADLVKQVVSFARGIEGDRTIVQVRHLISEIRQIAKETFPKSIEVYTDAFPDLWTVCGDATQLHQVLMNLCVNARDALPDGGTLSISAQNIFIDDYYARLNIDATVGSYIVITVSDTGIGIPAETLDRIFEPFFTTKEIGKGTGLGLSTVIGIIKSHGGFVNVCSEVGQGTEFKVYLPAIEETETLSVNDLELPTGQGELILVVDDEAAIRKITQTSLETYAYKVLTASDGIEAIALYAQHKAEISLVLIDMMMPEMDGLTAIRTLRKMNPNLKIVAVSGLNSNDNLAQVAVFDVNTFLSKPYTTKNLLETINAVLSTG